MATKAVGKAGAKTGGTGRFSQDERRRDSDHVSFLKHRGFRWLWIALLLSGASIAGYLLIDQEPRSNGGTWYGYTLGTIGFGLILWLSLLGVRKRRINPGAWSLKAWTSAHVYLGLALAVVGTLHTGFQIGWNVHTLAYVLMLLVIITGIYGVIVYATLPASLSANRKEMTRAQMLDALTALDRQLESAAQPLARGEADLVIAALKQDVFHGGVLARLTGRYPRCATAIAMVCLDGGSEAEKRVEALLVKRHAQLQQIRGALRIRAMLEIWLFVHIPLTVALIAALTAHVISVFYYW
ncbi:MAG: hypothetical protein NBV68_01860 [Erythrobacter sp.]|uniref:hypothetical protein n=1 Tax=Erythrobacter sp. TaxID=1042 RepID=UPI0025EEDC30|nr:hypothetical protein [Erythrobacter sp.]MCL9998103.1 hypothetical protein [Erythrobacter sp.]